MTESYLRRFRLFYAAQLIISAESVEYAARQYEDSKFRISLKKTTIKDDTIIIHLKELDDLRVFEICLCPLPFNQRDMNQVYLRGYWENYLTDILLKNATEKIKNRHRGETIEDFIKWLRKYGPADDTDLPTITIGTVNDEAIFESNNQPRE